MDPKGSIINEVAIPVYCKFINVSKYIIWQIFVNSLPQKFQVFTNMTNKESKSYELEAMFGHEHNS